MYLRELTLKGFKSFASATTLRFEPGITAVVGPNGSGKSNIVDALAWVMGEQGAKNLRGSSMEDVIFAGTPSKPPLGRAQVILTIDNADHALDIDYAEVTISRTIFRNGGSEYAINGTPCRLLDVQELLSDTGLGQQMHVIVGQGRLDQILKADPSGHRAFIEEASGILKHRRRKERALRKLANTQTNLSRLDDLLAEIHRQLGPLGRQARTARRADGIRIALRDAKARLYADDLTQIMNRQNDLHDGLSSVRSELTTARRELARTKIRIEQVERMNGEASSATAQADQQWHELSRLQERLHSLESVARERSKALEGRIVENLGDDPDLLNARADELDKQRHEQAHAVDDARRTLDRSAERRARQERELASIRQTLQELRRLTQQRDSRIANLREMIAREESAVQLAASRGKDFTAQRDRLAQQRQQAEAQRDHLRHDAQLHGKDDGSAALDHARQQLAARQDALNALHNKQRDLNGRIIALRAKADALNDTLENRNATGALERDETVPTLGKLTDFIKVAEGWEEAVAHALDVFANALVVPERKNLLDALEYAREDGLGKAVVITPVDEPIDDDSVAFDGVGHASSGAQSWRSAAELVGVNPAAHDRGQAVGVVRAVQSMLKDVAAVETLDEAVRATSGMDDGGKRAFSQAVTKAGEIVNPVGGVGGSSASQSDLSLAARRDKALNEVSRLEKESSALADRVETARADRDQARLEVDRAASERTAKRVTLEQDVRSLHALDDRIADLERQMRSLDERITATQGEHDMHRDKVDDLKHALAAAQQDGEDEGAGEDELAKREHDCEREFDQAREQEMNSTLAWTDADRKLQSLQRQIDLLREQAKAAGERRSRIIAANERYRAQADRALRIASDASRIAQLVGQSVEQASERRDALHREASDHDGELKTLRARRDDIEPRVNELVMREHALDVDRERLVSEHDRIVQAVAKELGLDAEPLMREYGPDVPVPVLDDIGRPVPQDDTVEDAERICRTVPYVREEQERRLNKAEHDLVALGKVNPLAGEEYEALQTRNQYLRGQRDDVAKSRDDLMALIRDLDTTMADVFRQAFDDTASAFERVFSTLFPGGTGRLRLDNPDDMLSTGVIVEASPAGKRVRQLSLLSGGERSLTALALLFAIFTARPSPFYVMDEVEAALDDVNLTRLLNALEQLRSHAQLIVITHQQRTMSIADALYGVTMRADGVTSVVSQRLPDHA